MKKLFCLLLSAFMVIAASGAAFAFDTDKHYSAPDASYYESNLSGAANVSVAGIDTVAAKVDGNALGAFLSESQEHDMIVSLAYVSFDAPTGSEAVTYTKEDTDILYNFALSAFDPYVFAPASAGDNTSSLRTAASRSITFSASGSSPSGYDDPGAASGTTGFVSVMGSSSGQEPKSLGCSTMTMGALALFMLPMLAMMRGRK